MSKGHPDISVVMSVYNGAQYLRESIDSILSQEGVDIECIIVNDGSTDESGDILREYADRDERVRVFDQENQGLTKALIRGCAESRGKYIARQDVGDISLSNRFYLQKEALDADQKISFISCWTEFCGPQFEFLYINKGSGNAKTPINIINEKEVHGIIDGPTSHPSVMIRKDAYLKVGGYRAEFYYGQDWDLWYRLAEIGKFQIIGLPLYTARLIPNSISAFAKKQQESFGKLSFVAHKSRRRGLPEQSLLDETRTIRPVIIKSHSNKHTAQWLYFIGECLRKNGDHRSLNYFKKSARQNPLYFKTWLRILQASCLLRREIDESKVKS